MQVRCSNNIQLIRPQYRLIFVERKVATASFVGARGTPCRYPFFFVKSQDPKGKMKFERTPDIPVIAGDVIIYGVACFVVFRF